MELLMFYIHNMMEELILEHVNSLYDQVVAGGSSWLSCDCENCRMDTVTYVLNRIPPRYVVSGRGVTHNANLLNINTQLNADVNKLCVEGMRLVNNAKRPYHNTKRKTGTIIHSAGEAAFNFPTFFGNIFDGNTFEPLSDANVLLKIDGKIADMQDITWTNPCLTYKATKGNYTFWVAPQSANSEAIKKDFTFTVEVSAYGYQETKYSFTVPFYSEKLDRSMINSNYSLKIKDIFLFRDDDENSKNQNDSNSLTESADKKITIDKVS